MMRQGLEPATSPRRTHFRSESPWISQRGYMVGFIRTQPSRFLSAAEFVPVDKLTWCIYDALADGYIYCIAGFGSGTHWLANLKANPIVEVHVAGTALRGSAEIVTESEEAQRIFIQIIHNCGFASLLLGLNPLTLTDEKILQKRGPEVVVRIRPTEMIGGSLDPGGRGWILTTLVQVAFFLWMSRLLFGRKNGASVQQR